MNLYAIGYFYLVIGTLVLGKWHASGTHGIVVRLPFFGRADQPAAAEMPNDSNPLA